MIWIYKIMVYALWMISLPFLPVVFFFSAKRRANLLQRFGFQKIGQKLTGKKRIWIHALSVGEVRSALPFIQGFRQRFSQWEICFSASTRTGFETAAGLYLNGNNKWVDHLFYFPFDIGFSVRRTLRQVRPDVVVLVETDLWPTFLHQMVCEKIPVVLINARLSVRSYRGYALYRKLGLPFYRYLSYVMVQGRTDRERLEKLGMPDNRIFLSGNIKFDQPLGDIGKAFIERCTKRLGIDDKTVVWLCGSTHTGEEKMLAAVFQTLRQTYPDLKLVIAPRNPDRSRAVAKLFEDPDIRVDFFSRCDENMPGGPVIVVDAMGLLSDLYALCDIAFIGGSMVKRGGHNPLEASALGKPVLFGPDMSDFVDIAGSLVENEAAMQADSIEELEEKMKLLLSRPDTGHRLGENGASFFLKHKGAVQRILDKMQQENFV